MALMRRPRPPTHGPASPNDARPAAAPPPTAPFPVPFIPAPRAGAPPNRASLAAPPSAAPPLARAAERSPRRRLATIGLAAVLVHVAIVTTALSGLREVSVAHRDLARIVTAQRSFQDADMGHDAILASVLGGLTEASGLLGPTPTGPGSSTLAEAVQGFQDDLRRVDAVPLPAQLETLVDEVRPAQDAYARDAVRAAAAVVDDPVGARPLVQALREQHARLTAQQMAVTTAMSAEADRRRRAAAGDERDVRDRLLASAVVALLGLLGMTVLLRRMGGDLSALLARERGVAETLQCSLLPDRLPDVPGLRLAARYRAGGVGTQVGGDWYDVVPLPGGRVGLVMGDVVGHDLHAASSMGQLRNALRACAADGAEPEEVLQKLNRLCVTQDLGEMATVVYAVLDPVTSVVQIANAGHLPPLLVAGQERRYLEATPCPPVGVVREAQFTSTSYALPAGSVLVLFTDGLVERRDEALDDGLHRLAALVTDRRGDDLEALCDDVLAGMLSRAAPADDVALLVVAPQAVLGPRVDVVWPAEGERLSMLRDLVERWLSEAGAADDEVYDILVACSEAATNAVEHAYGPGLADFRVVLQREGRDVTIVVRDWGQYREARGRDRGRGLGLMEGLMDEVELVRSDHGTEVRLRRRLRAVPVPSSDTPVVGSP